LQASAAGRAAAAGAFGSTNSCNCTRPDIGLSKDDWKLIDQANGGWRTWRDLFPNWVLTEEKDAGSDAKAPGKPSAADGFEEGKDGGPLVPNPNGPGKGYRDKRGRVWCPTGPSPGKAHGGPHWDVQFPDGGHTNVMPGGGVRGRALK
jgi:hypothetical protein